MQGASQSRKAARNRRACALGVPGRVVELGRRLWLLTWDDVGGEFGWSRWLERVGVRVEGLWGL